MVFRNIVRTISFKRTATAAAILLAAVSCVIWSEWGFLRTEFAIREKQNGHLDDLSPLAEYLGSALDSKDYGLLAKRAEYLESSLKRNAVSNEASDALGLLDEYALGQACSAVWKTAEGPLGKFCENAVLEGESEKWSVHECSKFRFEETRKDCRERNDLLFSKFSDSHCSKAECVVDNAVYRAKILRIPPCLDVHASLLQECRRMAETFDRYSADPASFSKPELESALDGKTADPIWTAARSAVLEFPDSPSEACAKFMGNDQKSCEEKSKELFSYVQFRWLKNRLDRIAEAVKNEP